jgi:uncharacterized membrane protein HdeD (DUF308 family)
MYLKKVCISSRMCEHASESEEKRTDARVSLKKIVRVVRGVWCVVCGVWCVVWCVVCGVWCVVCGVWCVVRGAWCVAWGEVWVV